MATTTTAVSGGGGLVQEPGATSTPVRLSRGGKEYREENNNDSTAVPDILPLMNGNAASDHLYIHRSKKATRGDSDGRQALISKRASRNSTIFTSVSPTGSTSTITQKEGLTRSESGHSLGALSYTTYDPKTTGSLSRSEEVNISLYNQGPHRRSYESLIDDDYLGKHGKTENVEIQWTVDNSGTMEGVAEQAEVTLDSGSLTRSSHLNSNSHDHVNGHAESGSMTISSENVTSSKSTSQVKRQSLENGKDSEGMISITSTKRSSKDLDKNGSLERGSSVITKSATNSIDRKSAGRPRKPQTSAATGSFQLRSAYNSLPKDEPKSPAASDEKFKGSLQDTLSRSLERTSSKTVNTATPSSPARSRKAGSSPKLRAKSEGAVGRSNSGSKRNSSARSSTIERDAAASPKAESVSEVHRSGSLTRSDVATENVRVSRTESSSSHRSRISGVGNELSKKESVRSTTSTASSAIDPGRPPSGKGGKVSRSSSTTEPSSPRSPTTFSAVSVSTSSSSSFPAKRSESTKSTSLIKSSSIERLAEPKHKRTISNERRERRGSVDSGTGRGGSLDSTGRDSGSESGSARRDSVGRRDSPSGSRSSSKEGKRSSSASAVENSIKTTTVTKTESNRSGSVPAYAASTSSYSAKRTESGRSSTGRPSRAASRTDSNASNKGNFSIQHSTGSVSPPGSVFDIANDDPPGEKKRESMLSVDTSGAKVKRVSSNSSQRKVTEALALNRTPSKTSQENRTPTSSSNRPIRTSSLVKAENKHKVITKSLFSELQAKHGSDGSRPDKQKPGTRKEAKEERFVSEFKIETPMKEEITLSPSRGDEEEKRSETIFASSVITTRTDSVDGIKERPSSLIEKRRGSKESLSLDLGNHQQGADTSQIRNGDAGASSPGEFGVVSSAPLSPLVEAQKTVKQGTVGRLVKGKFKDLNLTARLMDANSPIEKKRDTDTDDSKTKYKFLVEGIDVPLSEENKDSIVSTGGTEETSIEGVEKSGGYYQEENVTNFSTLSSTTSGGESNYNTLTRTDQEDSAPSEGNSLDRPHRPKRGFTYILDEKHAEEVTKRASYVTARKPHEQADKVHGTNVSTLEREKEEKALKDARAKLHKAQPVEKSHSAVPGSGPEIAYSSVLRGTKDRGGNASEKNVETEEETVVSVNSVPSNEKQDLGIDRRTQAGSHTVTTSVGNGDISVKKTAGKHKSTTSTRVVKSSGTDGFISEDKNMKYSRTADMRGGERLEDVRGGGVDRRGVNGPTTMKISSNLGQLSPDSAYQSDSPGSPAFEGKNYTDNTRGGSTEFTREIKQVEGDYSRSGAGSGGGSVVVGNTQPQEVTVQRLQQDETVAQGAHSRYESKQRLLTESKVSNKTLSEPGVNGSGASEVKAYSTSNQSSYSKTFSSTTTGDGTGSTSTSADPGDNYVISTRRNESITRVGGRGGGEGEGEGIVSSATGGSTYVDRHSNFQDQFKPSEVEEPPRRSTKHSIQQNVVRTTTRTTKTTTSQEGAAGEAAAAAGGIAGDAGGAAGGVSRGGGGVGQYENSASGSVLTREDLRAVKRGGGVGGGGGSGGVHTDVISKQETALTSETRGSQTAGNRRYLPVGEDGGVRMTVGEPGIGEETLRSATTSTTTTLPDLNAAPMRVENKENVSHKVVRESNYSSSTSSTLPGGSERHPLGNHSSFGSADYNYPSLTNGNSNLRGGQQGNRVIPLAPLTVDINTPNDSFEMATHPASVTSPTGKHHTMTMYEMSMNDGASGNFGRAPYDYNYDGPYGGSLQQSGGTGGGYPGSRYMPPARPHFDDDYQNYHNHRNTGYQEQHTLSSQQSSYRSSQSQYEYMDGTGSGGGFDTVSRSFRHIPGSPSQPKYLKVDESRSGSMPMYRDHNISVRESGGGLRHGIQGYGGRGRNESYVSRAYVEGEHYGDLHGDYYDGDSVKSEPAYSKTRRSEKILSNRRPLRRHASSSSGNATYHTLPSRRVHLDEPLDVSSGAYNSYHDGGGTGGYSTLRSGAHRSHSSLYSPPGDGGPPIVSPELQGARKKQDLYGDQYHITLKLNQLNKDIGASRNSLHSARSERVDLRDDHRFSNSLHHQSRGGHQDNMYTSAMSLPDMHTSYNSRGYDNHDEYASLREDRYHYGDEGYGGSPTRTVTNVELDNPVVREQFEDRLSWYRARKAAQQEAHYAPVHVDVSHTNGYHQSGSSFSSSGPTSRVAPHPGDADYTMSIDQTMTMGYVPTQKEEAVNVMETEHQMQSTPQKTNIYISADENRNRRVVEEEVTTYDETDDGEAIPQVVRGSILIKNTIDTAGKPRVIDVVADDDEEEFTVEDNSNMFHGKYFQLRENPMYNSDEDLSKLHRRPAFTKIFNRSEKEEFTEIPVNYGRAHTSGGKSTTTTTTTTTKSKKNLLKGRKSEYLVNGRDETDLNFEDIHERTMRTRGPPPMRETKRSTEMEIARLIRNAPADSVKQRINVEREEEEIMGPLPVNHADGTDGDPSGMLNFDTISEKVDIGLQEGVAQLAVKVRCERIVPIRGIEDMFKKSSVIVTRLIEIDLGVTEERKRLYDNVMRGGMSQTMLEDRHGGRPAARGAERKLGTKETFKLYKMFMGIAEAEEGKKHDRLNIEQRIEDEKLLPDGAEFDFDTEGIHQDGFDFDDNLGFNADELDNQLESAIHNRSRARTTESRVKLEAMPGGRGHLMKNPEPDTISYISQASEQSDLLY